MRPVRLRIQLLLAALWALGLAGPASPGAAAALSVAGASEKVCQLTGQTDWYSGQTTDAQTQARYGLTGVDLGFPVESGDGRLLFLFGDTVPNEHPPNVYPTLPPDDATGWTGRTAAPDEKSCLDMKLFSPGPQRVGHPTVTPPIQQGSFNVPSGGIGIDDTIYAFFWTAHCVIPNPVVPNPTAPLTPPVPPPGSYCPETAASSSLGTSILASAPASQPLAFTQIPPSNAMPMASQMPKGFIYATAAEPASRSQRPPGVIYPRPEGSPRREPPIPVFGVARYRASIPYLALAPRKSFGAIETWSFYGGMGANGPIWLSYQEWQTGQNAGHWAPPAGAEIYADSPNPASPTGDERCVGEHSATWNAPLRTWLLLYTCGGAQVEARTAPEPWGPWSKPTVLLSSIQDPGLYCHLFWAPPGVGCPGRTSQQPPILTFGYLYAPFVMTRFTEAEPAPAPEAKAKIYWLLSTWDPYQVSVMRTTLKLTP